MEEQYKKTFDQMVDSLKMYQRYELKDKNRKDILDKVYVDPIENDGILNLCLKDNTTVLIGRRGTGKSTIFMRMQNELRKQNDIMTCYIDVKSIFDVAKRNYITINYLKTSNLEEIEQYSIQRQFILDFVDELINEICKNYDTIWEKFKQKLHISKSQKAIDKLKNIRKRIQDNNHLSNIEMQTLQEVMHSNVDNMKKYGGTCLKCGCKNSIQEKRVLSDEERSEIEEIEKKDNLLEREQYQLLKLLQYSRKDKTATELAQELDVSWQKIGWIAKKIEEDYCYLKKEPRKGKMYYVLSDLGREYLDSITP